MGRDTSFQARTNAPAISLLCAGCQYIIRTLQMREIAEAIRAGTPFLPARCSKCGKRFSDESQDRLRKHIYAVNQGAFTSNGTFDLYPADWKRPME